MSAPKPKTRIQRENVERILDAALDVFSQAGFRGATLDRIAEVAGMSKPNILYYFRSKEEMHVALLSHQLEDWLDPLRELSADGDPLEEIRDYIHRKMEMARKHPRESRLFANEIMQGAPRIGEYLSGPLKELVEEKAAVIQGWMDTGKLARADPRHLIFAIWATTQHYADFDTQIRLVLGVEGDGHIDDAARFLEGLFLNGLAVQRHG